jgi:hypothetical protein
LIASDVSPKLLIGDIHIQKGYEMDIVKSEGVTPTERLLASLCEQSFLKLWSYPNPYKDDGDELCDLLAVFENHVFIFFDRENKSFSNEQAHPITQWNRWKRRAIDDQTRSAHGAERYISSGRPIFLDRDMKVPFPIRIPYETTIIHKIIVAHGAKEACSGFSERNVYGSLGISYGNSGHDFPVPFIVHIDRENPVHVFDSHNLPIVLGELDTLFDFSSYLDAKVDAIRSLDALVYCGEEDLLAHYFMNFDKDRNKHFIGTTKKDVNHVMICEGEWKEFIEIDVYKRRKFADKVSYFWDELIQKTCQNALSGSLLGNSDPFKGQSAIHEMAKEPRFSRRALSEHMIRAIENFPDSTSRMMRHVSFMPSFYKGKAYVFLQLKVLGITDYEKEYRPIRRAMLEIACGAVKNKFNELNTIIGIAIDAPKYTNRNSEDFILMDCEHWTDDLREHYAKENEVMGFFQSESLVIRERTVTEFPTHGEPRTQDSRPAMIGRNAPCPCGSGKKYKKCCIDLKG